MSNGFRRQGDRGERATKSEQRRTGDWDFAPAILRTVSREEGVPVATLKQGLQQGTIVIPMNARRGRRALGLRPEALGVFRPVAIGQGLRTKVNANLGTSPDRANLRSELAKLKVACAAGADTVMDLSTGGDIPGIRRAILAASPVPVGTVPLYEASFAARRRGKSFVELTPQEILDVVEAHCRDGVDFITVHCGIRQAAFAILKRGPRLTGVVSRGGSMILEWMKHNRQDNPLYERYDELLAIARASAWATVCGPGRWRMRATKPRSPNWW